MLLTKIDPSLSENRKEQSPTEFKTTTGKCLIHKNPSQIAHFSLQEI